METYPKDTLPGPTFRPLFLIGEYDSSIDEKNRLLIPADLRNEIVEARQEKVLLCRIGRKKVPWLYPENYYRELLAKRKTSLTVGEDEEAFNESYYGMTYRIAWDAQGRVVLPEKMMARTNLQRNVTIIGAGDHLVIRNREDWEQRSEMLIQTQDDLTDRTKEKSETGPAA